MLWPVGCYWHLATRKEEHDAMAESVFKAKAHAIDEALSHAQFKTLVHGDAKFANLCFHQNTEDIAAVDFQYVGCGSGVKDLAYLVGSCLSNEELYRYEEKILDEYLLHIKNAIQHYNKDISLEDITTEVKRLYPIAWADFYRFLLGWNPESWKICDFMRYKAQQGIDLV